MNPGLVLKFVFELDFKLVLIGGGIGIPARTLAGGFVVVVMGLNVPKRFLETSVLIVKLGFHVPLVLSRVPGIQLIFKSCKILDRSNVR